MSTQKRSTVWTRPGYLAKSWYSFHFTRFWKTKKSSCELKVLLNGMCVTMIYRLQKKASTRHPSKEKTTSPLFLGGGIQKRAQPSPTTCDGVSCGGGGVTFWGGGGVKEEGTGHKREGGGTKRDTGVRGQLQSGRNLSLLADRTRLCQPNVPWCR